MNQLLKRAALCTKSRLLTFRTIAQAALIPRRIMRTFLHQDAPIALGRDLKFLVKIKDKAFLASKRLEQWQEDSQLEDHPSGSKMMSALQSIVMSQSSSIRIELVKLHQITHRLLLEGKASDHQAPRAPPFLM